MLLPTGGRHATAPVKRGQVIPGERGELARVWEGPGADADPLVGFRWADTGGAAHGQPGRRSRFRSLLCCADAGYGRCRRVAWRFSLLVGQAEMRPWSLVLAAMMACLALPVAAEPPPGADPSSPTAAWFRGLQQPHTGFPCCSVADCRTVTYRINGDHYEVFIDRKSFGPGGTDAWEPVPKGNVIRTDDNPTGQAVACWYAGEVRCFVEASAS